MLPRLWDDVNMGGRPKFQPLGVSWWETMVVNVTVVVVGIFVDLSPISEGIIQDVHHQYTDP